MIFKFKFVGLFINIYFFKHCLCSDLYSDKVRKYDSESFKVNVGGDIAHFINFFAPWCGYCKRLKPVWDELAEKYNIDSPNEKIIIAKVDCTSETPLCADENVSGYPSLIFYNAGEKKGTKYQGRRDLISLEEFISANTDESKKKNIPPPKTPVHTTAVELTDETFHGTVDFGLHFVKFYAPWCGHCQKMAASWEELAENSQNDPSVKISSVDCTKYKKACQDFEVKGYPTLLWIVDGKKVERYQGARNFAAFKQFVIDMKEAYKERIEKEEGPIPEIIGDTPNLVVELTKDNFENAIAKDFTFVKFYVNWCSHSRKFAPVFENLAVKFAPEPNLKLARVNCAKNDQLCSDMKIVGYPTLLLFQNGKRITEYTGPRKLDYLHIFLLNYLHHTEL